MNEAVIIYRWLRDKALLIVQIVLQELITYKIHDAQKRTNKTDKIQHKNEQYWHNKMNDNIYVRNWYVLISDSK